MKTIRDLDAKNKTILVRVDYNVPLKDGKVDNDLRIRASLPTLKYLLDHGAKRLILISHLGRPDGAPDPAFSLSPVADALRKLLAEELPEFKNETKIGFYPLPTIGNTATSADTTTFADTASSANTAPSSDANASTSASTKVLIPDYVKIALLENLRFDPGEKANSADFIKSIIDATGSEAFVQDGFAVVHRAHASTDAVKNFLPVYAGLLVEKEVNNLSAVLSSETSGKKLLIIGGAKVEDKEPLIAKLAPDFDCVFVGGKIAADGYTPTLPKVLVADDFDEDSAGQKLDIGPLSAGQLAGLIIDSDLIIWNGLLGYAEDPAYATSSTLAAELIGEKTAATTIICGGDTTGFVENLMREHPNLNYSLVSTGGGAALEFLLGKTLPGLAAIQN